MALSKGSFHLSEPAGQTNQPVNGMGHVEGIILQNLNFLKMVPVILKKFEVPAYNQTIRSAHSLLRTVWSCPPSSDKWKRLKVDPYFSYG